MFVVALTLAADVDGRRRHYADETTAQRVVDHFDISPDRVTKVSDATGIEWRIACAEQRGPSGAYRVHQVACAHNIPAYVA